MKRAFLALALISCGIATGNSERPAQIRVCLQFIEVPHATLTEMLASRENSGQALHDKATALSRNGAVKLMETCMVVCRSGEKALIESIREEIYPAEYPTGRMLYCPPLTTEQLAKQGPTTPVNPLYRQISAFDTRNTGVTFEVESTLSANGMIDLRLSPEIVTPLRLETWMEHVDQWGDGSIRMPVYETLRLNTSINVKSGKFELVSALTPKANAPVPAVSRKILVFVRADVLGMP